MSKLAVQPQDWDERGKGVKTNRTDAPPHDANHSGAAIGWLSRSARLRSVSARTQQWGKRRGGGVNKSGNPWVRAMLTSIPGIGFIPAAGVASELGSPKKLPCTDSLCAYSGIVPPASRSGGPGVPAQHGSTGPRCNRILKDWVVQSAQKIALYGPPELKDRMAKWQANGQHAAFAEDRPLGFWRRVAMEMHGIDLRLE